LLIFVLIVLNMNLRFKSKRKWQIWSHNSIFTARTSQLLTLFLTLTLMLQLKRKRTAKKIWFSNRNKYLSVENRPNWTLWFR
jgi:hypothetical protein